MTYSSKSRRDFTILIVSFDSGPLDIVTVRRESYWSRYFILFLFYRNDVGPYSALRASIGSNVAAFDAG